MRTRDSITLLLGFSMSYTLKNIKVICIIVCYFCVFDANLLAIDCFRHRAIVQKKENHMTATKVSVEKCRKSKANNFQDRSPEDRIVLTYLNTLLDRLLSDNKDILEKQFKRSIDEFCIDTETILGAPFADAGLGLILVDIERLYSKLKSDQYIYESFIMAGLSHEVAHDLLNHMLEEMDKRLEIYDNSSFKNNYSTINKYNFDERLLTRDQKEFDKIITILKTNMGNYKEQMAEFDRCQHNQDKIQEEYEKWLQFYTSHPDYIALNQSHEIDADSLGLKLYLNTGFKPEDFGKQYINQQYSYIINTPFYAGVPNVFKNISEKNYIDKGEEAKKTGKFDEFMNSIKYMSPTETHPSMFWSYWNARNQIEAANLNLYRGIQNAFYFKIDLSVLNALEEFKTFLSNPNNINISIKNEKDPRVQIINGLLTSSSQSLNYTIEFFPYNSTEVGLVLEDNTILLKAHAVYTLSLIKKSIPTIKEKSITLHRKNLSTHPTGTCPGWFSKTPIIKAENNELYDIDMKINSLFYSAIEGTFLSK